MNRENVRKQLEIDEGVVYEIYEDHLGYATFGIGHLVKRLDLEHGWRVGTPVSEERVMQAFEADFNNAVRECAILYDMWNHVHPSLLYMPVSQQKHILYPCKQI